MNEGDEVPNKGVPYTVAIVYKKPDGARTVCGGLLFAGGCVLSAAHCEGPPGSVYEIYQGNSIEPENMITYGTVMEPMTRDEKKWPQHDLALLKLHGAAPEGVSVPVKNLLTKKLKPGTKLKIAGPGQNRSYVDASNEVQYSDDFGDFHQGTVTVQGYERNPNSWGWRIPNGTVLMTGRGENNQISAPGDSGSAVKFQRRVPIIPGLMELVFPEQIAGVTSMVIYDMHDKEHPHRPEDIQNAAFASFVDPENVKWVKKTVEKLDCEHNTQKWVQEEIRKVLSKNVPLEVKFRPKLPGQKWREVEYAGKRWEDLFPETKNYLNDNIRKLANVPPEAQVEIGSPTQLAEVYGLYFPVTIQVGEQPVNYRLIVPYPSALGTKPVELSEIKTPPIRPQMTQQRTNLLRR